MAFCPVPKHIFPMEKFPAESSLSPGLQVPSSHHQKDPEECPYEKPAFQSCVESVGPLSVPDPSIAENSVSISGFRNFSTLVSLCFSFCCIDSYSARIRANLVCRRSTELSIRVVVKNKGVESRSWKLQNIAKRNWDKWHEGPFSSIGRLIRSKIKILLKLIYRWISL